ncbi:MAG: ABC transporter ATP-binding protein [Candidatus Magnetobacterium sp. LHC-1]|uniref:ABC transporter ATP-binding protein n=1 Tax=Candidatus Magnetobacterium casense TaxID=1455061 RepID=UPI001C46B4B6|nr:ABC transporter ATP-binding protein [Candidatus Magnetobacterium casensis]
MAVTDSAGGTVLQVVELRKSYGKTHAVDGISFAFQRGEFVGLLGPNGAGKTTTIKMLSGLIKPSAGNIAYFGKDFVTNQRFAKSTIGCVPQINNLDRDLTAYQNMYHHALLYDITDNATNEKITEALQFAGLTNYIHRKVKTFSGGTMRRLVIARALLHQPKILFLDEPTVGLDPQIRRDIWDYILKVNQIKKTTILLTTHYIEEAERLCQKILIINNGRIIAEGNPDALKQDMGHYVLEIFNEDGIEERFFDDRDAAVTSLKGCLQPCKIREVTLEDVFLKLTGRRLDA